MLFCVCLQYEDTQSQLLDLRQRYEKTEKEKLNIHQELEQCRSSLKLLQDKTSSVSTPAHLCPHFEKTKDFSVFNHFICFVKL